jgi:hypothetical protein
MIPRISAAIPRPFRAEEGGGVVALGASCPVHAVPSQ